MELPKIRQVVFRVESNRNYQFDVNQTITIRGLKRMISVAAGLPKVGLRIFHKEEEYTEYDESSLNELFPQLDLVEFGISISVMSSMQSQERESQIKLKLGDYCKSHDYKYLYFYCYDCKKSLCSICVQGPAHQVHNVIEKYDYLQSSKHLVDLIFKDINKNISDPQNSQLHEADCLKTRVKQFFSVNLHEMLTNMEMKIIDLIDFYVQSCQCSIGNISSNVQTLKTQCITGLDKLKEAIEIEKLMMNEEIFLTFDKKYSEISSNEQYRLHEDSKKLNELNSHFKSIAEMVDFIYNDTYKFLDDKINLEVYSDLRKKIHASEVCAIRSEEITDKILSEVKGKKRNSRLDVDVDVDVDVNVNMDKLVSIFGSDGVMPGPAVSGTSDFVNEKTSLKEESKSNKESASRYIMTIHPETQEVLVYDDHNLTLERRELDFPQFCGICQFLKFSSSCNYNGKLYISGGQLTLDSGSNSFVMYDPIQDTLKRLPDMIYQRYCHSLLANNDFIYAVGGYQNNTCERYDVQKMTWIKLCNLNVEERQYPILHVYGNFLYAFFGYTIGTYLESIERINIKNNLKAKWEFVPYKNPDKIDLKIIGCGIVPCESHELYFFGGKTKDEMKKDTFKFNFMKNMFNIYDLKLDDPTYFCEASLISLGNQSYGHFDSDSGSHFLRILLG